MLKVTIEMWPRGDHSRAYVLAIGTLALLGVDERGLRRYRVRLLKDTRFRGPDGSNPGVITRPPKRTIWKEGVVSGHDAGPRGGWDLLGGALGELLGTRLRGYTASAGDGIELEDDYEKARLLLDGKTVIADPKRHPLTHSLMQHLSELHHRRNR